MHTFFYGWRRKAGCVTLVMACVLMGMWMRTTVVADYFSAGAVAFGSARGGIYWFGSLPTQSWEWEIISEEELRSSSGDMTLAEMIKDEASTAGEDSVFYGYVLYRWVVLPLTLLSAYLILRKPRKQSSPK
jgi:hypothetical protein